MNVSDNKKGPEGPFVITLELRLHALENGCDTLT